MIGCPHERALTYAITSSLATMEDCAKYTARRCRQTSLAYKPEITVLLYWDTQHSHVHRVAKAFIPTPALHLRYRSRTFQTDSNAEPWTAVRGEPN